jgi:hypothetical protein
MAHTFGELQAEALHDEFSPNKYATLVGRWMNEAIGKIGRRVELPALQSSETIATVAGTSAYDIPEDSVLFESLRYPDGQGQLEKLSIEAFDRSFSSGRGRPSSYTLYGSRILLTPTPDREYTLEARYRTATPEFSAATPIDSIFPHEYADLLVSYARSRAFRAEDDFEAAQLHMAEFWEGVNRMAGEVHYRSREVSQVPGTLEEYAGPQFVRPS